MAAEKVVTNVTGLGELPSHTVIDSVRRGMFIKDEEGKWQQLYFHCNECAVTLDDTWGYKNLIYNDNTGREDEVTASRYIGKYVVLSRPVKKVQLRVQGKWETVTADEALAYMSTKFWGWVKDV